MWRSLAGIALAFAVTVGISACTPFAPQPTPSTTATTARTMDDGTAQKQGDGELRTDLAPIVKRYPQLSGAESIEWVGGTTGTSDIGPTTYWVDVVAVLPASELEALSSTVNLEAVDPPDLVPEMAAKVPAGPFEGGSELDALFSAAGYSASVAIDRATRTVVLSGLFE